MSRRVTIAVAAALALVLSVALTVTLVAASYLQSADDNANACAEEAQQQVSTSTTGPAIDVAARAALSQWTGADAVIALAIAGAESRYDAHAQNAGSSAKGVWQTMMSLHADKYHGDSWADPFANARVAHIIWRDAGGWTPWTTYTSGAYRAHLAEARAAIARISSSGGTTASTTPVAATTDDTHGLQPVAIQAETFIRQHWGFKGTIIGYAKSGHMENSKHYQGLALDVMLPIGSESNGIAAYFTGPGYTQFSVENVIHNHEIYNRPLGWHAYPEHHDATLDHEDHVHIDFREDGAAQDVATLTDPAVACSIDQGAVSGAVVYPEPKDTDSHNYGNGGSHWARGHTGTDFSVPCGRPVKAATAGTVVIENGPSWYGTWLVKVSTGARKLTTWYAHMQALNVTAGEQVKPGQVLGEVGDRGNATGCHLHFEVHPHGGGIYEDGVNPSTWLANHVGRNVDGVTGALPAVSAASGGIRVATFNVLGAAHTGGRGKHPGMASGTRRMAGVVTLLGRYRVDVVGLQEFERPQYESFERRLGSSYDTWFPGHDTENAIAWRRSTFTRVDQRAVSVPYFDGHHRRMPFVLLRDRQTDQEAWFGNFHNPADTARYHHQARYRRAAVRIEAAAANRLAAPSVPVLVTGDMNDHEPFYCDFTGRTGMHAAAGGSHGASHCAPPSAKRARIDWIMGTPDIAFTGYTVDDSALVDRTSDHPFSVTQVQTQ